MVETLSVGQTFETEKPWFVLFLRGRGADFKTRYIAARAGCARSLYSRELTLRYNIHCFDVMLIFPKYCALYKPP